MPWYHYTCPPRSALIRIDGGILRPGIALAGPQLRDALRADRVLGFTSQVIWLTTIAHLTPLNQEKVGLTANLPGACDRTAERWEITEEDVEILPWTDIRLRWPRLVVNALEGLPGVRPGTWGVSRGPLQARFAPHRIPAMT